MYEIHVCLDGLTQEEAERIYALVLAQGQVRWSELAKVDANG